MNLKAFIMSDTDKNEQAFIAASLAPDRTEATENNVQVKLFRGPKRSAKAGGVTRLRIFKRDALKRAINSAMEDVA
jgi:hypothetical protein